MGCFKKTMFKPCVPYFLESGNKSIDGIRIANLYHEVGAVKINVTKQKKLCFHSLVELLNQDKSILASEEISEMLYWEAIAYF